MGEVVKLLEFEGYRLPAFQRHGNKLPWFALADGCKVLGLTSNSAVTDAAKRLDPDELDSIQSTDSTGRLQNIIAVSLSGLTRLAGSSRKPIAKRFNKWLHSDVIVSIFLTGEFKGDSTPLQELVGSFQPLLELPQPEHTPRPAQAPEAPKAHHSEGNVVSFPKPLQPDLFASHEQADMKVDSYRGVQCEVTLYDRQPIELTIEAPEATEELREELSHAAQCGNSFLADGCDIEEHCYGISDPGERVLRDPNTVHPLIYAESWIMYHLSHRGIPFSK